MTTLHWQPTFIKPTLPPLQNTTTPAPLPTN